MIAEGTALVTGTLATAPLGPFQLQAAIAAVHDQAPTFEDTDWLEVLELYELLTVLAPGPIVELNRIVALAMVRGPGVALSELAALRAQPAIAGHHRAIAVHAHLLEMDGAVDAARAEYQRAAERTLNLPERRYLEQRAGRLTPGDGRPGP